MAARTFKRYEIKYVLSSDQFALIKEELQKHMVLDRNCKNNDSYMIYNLYFDTKNDDIIRKSISKPYYKEKLRLRAYNIPVSDKDLVYLELKKKIGDIVAKRRASLTYGNAMYLVEYGVLPQPENYIDRQVLEEIKIFLHKYPARPKVFISYERMAFIDINNPDFRVSFDSNIITRRNHLNFADGDFGTELIDNDCCLMEIKLTAQIPIWLCGLLSRLHVHSTSFSKYGTEYKQFILQQSSQKVLAAIV